MARSDGAGGGVRLVATEPTVSADQRAEIDAQRAAQATTRRPTVPVAPVTRIVMGLLRFVVDDERRMGDPYPVR